MLYESKALYISDDNNNTMKKTVWTETRVKELKFWVTRGTPPSEIAKYMKMDIKRIYNGIAYHTKGRSLPHKVVRAKITAPIGKGMSYRQSEAFRKAVSKGQKKRWAKIKSGAKAGSKATLSNLRGSTSRSCSDKATNIERRAATKAGSYSRKSDDFNYSEYVELVMW
jgi:hypothetical protein